MASGMVRRLDNLGRIVIPKEIRKDLKLKGNEKIEISIVDDSIVLNRYSDIKEYDNSIQTLIDVIKVIYEKDIIITNLNKIILTSNVYKEYLGLDMSSYLSNLLEKREEIYENIPIPLILVEKKDSIKTSYIVKPIIINGDIYGLVLLLEKNNLENTDLKLISLLNLYLENYLE